jgi:HSP20 family molecular chaperone IbpA
MDTQVQAPAELSAAAGLESANGSYAKTFQQQGWSPYVVREIEDGQLRYKLALPECEPQDIGMVVVSNQLVVQITLRDTGNGSAQTGRFEQVIQLPDGVKSAGIQARYGSGILTVVLPLSKRVSARRVPIEGV